jgi:hypothetical protein
MEKIPGSLHFRHRPQLYTTILEVLKYLGRERKEENPGLYMTMGRGAWTGISRPPMCYSNLHMETRVFLACISKQMHHFVSSWISLVHKS